MSRLVAQCENCPWEGSRSDTVRNAAGLYSHDECPNCNSQNVTVLDPNVDQPELENEN